jgi:hypothetical protein
MKPNPLLMQYLLPVDSVFSFQIYICLYVMPHFFYSTISWHSSGVLFSFFTYLCNLDIVKTYAKSMKI